MLSRRITLPPQPDLLIGARPRRQRRLRRTEYRHEVLVHLARIADALCDSERVEELEDFYDAGSADSGRVAILRGAEQALRGRARDERGIGGKARVALG